MMPLGLVLANMQFVYLPLERRTSFDPPGMGRYGRARVFSLVTLMVRCYCLLPQIPKKTRFLQAVVTVVKSPDPRLSLD